MPAPLSAERRKDILPLSIFFVYSGIHALMRVMASSTMELDEAEQFLKGSVFSLGYIDQPPLYSWIIKAASLLFGLNVSTIILVKHFLIFLFLILIYANARRIWDTRYSFIVTGAMALFPTYAYEFHRDLSHTVLVAVMASLTSFLFLLLLKRKDSLYYILIGVSVGLGILSKYNSVFFSLALVFAAFSFKGGREVLFSRKTLLSLAMCFLVLLPHLLWLNENNFAPFRHTMDEAGSGDLEFDIVKWTMIIFSGYAGILIFWVIFLSFFRGFIGRSEDLSPEIRTFRFLSFYGLAIPMLVILLLRIADFSERWLAPVLFVVPPALFSTLHPKTGRRYNYFGYLCFFIVISVLLVRVFIGFMPDITGKFERIHIPFRELSLKLEKELKQKQSGASAELLIVAENGHFAANIKAWLPGAKVVLLEDCRGNSLLREEVSRSSSSMLVWNAKKKGTTLPEEFREVFPSAKSLEPIKASYLRSRKGKNFVMGVASFPAW